MLQNVLTLVIIAGTREESFKIFKQCFNVQTTKNTQSQSVKKKDMINTVFK